MSQCNRRGCVGEATEVVKWEDAQERERITVVCLDCACESRQCYLRALEEWETFLDGPMAHCLESTP